MRRTISSGSVKAIYLDREKTLGKLREISVEALALFPEIREIRLFGSLAKGEETGTSDADVFILTESEQKNPVERMRPYFNFFTDRMDIAVDMITATAEELENFREILEGSVLLGNN